MKRTELKRSTKPIKRSPIKRVAVLAGTRARANGIGVPRRAVSPATPAQRAKVRDATCVGCGGRMQCGDRCHPAHLIPRGVTTVGQDDVLAVVPLCPDCHRRYDEGELDLLPMLERRCRPELAFAVMRVGLMSTLRRVTNHRWSPDGDMRGERY